MALIQCIECDNSVSDKASACPHCGCPVKPPKPTTVTCLECRWEFDFELDRCPSCGLFNSQKYIYLENNPSAKAELTEEKSNRCAANTTNTKARQNKNGFPFLTIVSVLIFITGWIIYSKITDNRGVEAFGSDLSVMRYEAENSAKTALKLIQFELVLVGLWFGLLIRKLLTRKW